MGTYKREGLQGSKMVDLTYVVPMAGQEAGDISPPTARGSDMSWLQVDMRRRSGARHCWLVYGREDARRRMVKTRNQCNKADGVDLVRWFDASCVSMLAAAAAAGDQYQKQQEQKSRVVSRPITNVVARLQRRVLPARLHHLSTINGRSVPSCPVVAQMRAETDQSRTPEPYIEVEAIMAGRHGWGAPSRSSVSLSGAARPLDPIPSRFVGEHGVLENR